MVSLIVATTSQTPVYNEHIVREFERIEKLTDIDIELVLELNDDVSLGTNYNNAVAKAKGDMIILLHNDVVLADDFIEKMVRDIKRGRLTTYSRVEPPIYTDLDIGKFLKDCGGDIWNFDREKFERFEIPDKIFNGGNLLFFGCYRDEYIGLDGDYFQKFCEDSDIHLRYRMLGFERIVSPALVYHFVSKTSRVGNYSEIERTSQMDFIRKWGFTIEKYNTYTKKYNKALILNVDKYSRSIHDLRLYEPFFDVIFIYKANSNHMNYIDKSIETLNQYSQFDISGKFLYINNYKELFEWTENLDLNVLIGVSHVSQKWLLGLNDYIDGVVKGTKPANTKSLSPYFPNVGEEGYETFLIDTESKEKELLWI